jgi:hypothetical protein
LRGFLSGLYRHEIEPLFREPVDLEIDLEGWGLVRLAGVGAEAWSVLPWPGGVWVELAGRVAGRVEVCPS